VPAIAGSWFWLGACAARTASAGLLVLTAGEYTVRILPPLVATKEELARGLQVLEEVL